MSIEVKIKATDIIGESLARQGIKHCFGIVGVPVIELGYAMQTAGINYYGFRNEQGAAYSAGICGYLTGVPGVALSVSGPGMTNCISGLANAWSNKWPMILIGGSNDISQDGTGGFQETNQVEAARPFVKYAVRVTDIKRIPFFIEKAVRLCTYGIPGPVYLDFPGDVLLSQIEESQISYLPKVEPIPPTVLSETTLQATLNLLTSAKRPLVIVGKGAAFGNAGSEMTEFINLSNLPFLPTPMGKGVVSDDHPNSVSPARTFALKSADVIFLVGARLNWMLHFGKAPRFNSDVKIIQLDMDAHEIHQNLQATLPIVADIKTVIAQLNQSLKKSKWSFNRAETEWGKGIKKTVENNFTTTKKLAESDQVPMSYYSALTIVQKYLPKDAIIVNEGANTMDIGRTIIKNYYPKHRLDAGSYGTMGVGFPFAIAAKAIYPEKRVVTVIGDSAFGFSAMELETAVRYNLPLTIIIINNNGIFTGVESIEKGATAVDIPVTALSVEAHYEKMADMLGGKGHFVTTPDQLEKAMKEVMAQDTLSIVNVMIEPFGVRKPQEFDWLTREDPKKAKL